MKPSKKLTNEQLEATHNLLADRRTISLKSSDHRKLVFECDGQIPDRETLLLFKKHIDSCLELSDESIEATNSNIKEGNQEQHDYIMGLFGTEKTEKKTNFIYLMKNIRNGFTKIGYSHSPQMREKTLQSEDPLIELVASFSGTLETERILHDEYHGLRVRGEWFNLSDNDIKDIIARFSR